MTCDCDSCRMARRVGELLFYACGLEHGIKVASAALHAGDAVSLTAAIKELAAAVAARNLTGEINAVVLENDLSSAADAREAGRLH